MLTLTIAGMALIAGISMLVTGLQAEILRIERNARNEVRTAILHRAHSRAIMSAQEFARVLDHATINQRG